MGGTKQRERDQRAPAFREWLADMEPELRWFFTEDAPQLGRLADPWTAEGIAVMVDALRAEFPTSAELHGPRRWHTVDRYRRFLGEALRRKAGGEWVNRPDMGEDADMWPIIDRVFSIPLDPHGKLFLAYANLNHPEGEMVWVFKNMVAEYRLWLDSGRPDAIKFLDIAFNHFVGKVD